MNQQDLKEFVKDVPDFPKAGIVFKDIAPLLASAKARKAMTAAIVSNYKNQKIDVVVGIESRGFLFGMLLAEALEASFVMLRKPNKLPGDIEKYTYDLEYGTDTIEIQTDAIPNGSHVLLHDDVLATGGTAGAAVQLIEKIGGKVVSANFIMELDFLEGRKQLGDLDIYSVLHY
ncbi:adenine phosphoribosyltransferase [Nonlabens sp. YIK11]|uniref:adenine phosphoribosyltransferase n=1 Tax=Nonlabens sp. YIK11 TaxID=1453349 RepID=UPI0006DD16A5|nr:adenine phosphoribosyltransferase [Nonlabens sp. YIK11]KQC33063.1 adenine phosphoribosyltransferase [Nonlabens sp. YIK11]